MMPSRLIAALFLSSSLLAAEATNAGKVSTVHVRREGRFEVSLSLDGHDIGSLSRDKMATFYVLPGYHQLDMRSGEICPSASFTAAPGREYFFKVNYDHVVSEESPRGLRVSLTAQPKFAATRKLRTAKVNSK
jgi:hypothetical protein